MSIRNQPKFDKSISLGSTWRHYKGGIYKVENIGVKESDETLQIIYHNIENITPYPWIRPYSEWNDIIEHNGEKVKRFTEC